MNRGHCFHCHELIPSGVEIYAEIKGEKHAMCCYGCKAVAEFIAQDYCEFYDYRGDSLPATQMEIVDEKWLHYDQEVNFKTYTKQVATNKSRVTVRLEGMYCSACGWLIDKHLKQLHGVVQVRLNSLTKIVQIIFDAKIIKLSQILSAINHLGYYPTLTHTKDATNSETSERKNALKRIVVAGFAMMFIMTLSVPMYSVESGTIAPEMYRFFALMSLFVATAVYFYSGKIFLRNAFRDLSNKHLGMDVPIALSLTLAYGVSVYNVLSHNSHTVYFDSMVMFVFFLLVGRYVEMTVRHQGMSANEALAGMIPASVCVWKNNDYAVVPLSQVQKGDILLVKSGQTIAIDGIITQGEAQINESMITGEQKPIKRQVQQKVMAGSVVETGEIQIKSLAIGEQTILASLAQLLETAQLQKPKTLQIVDKVASWFVAIVLLLSLATACYYALHDMTKVMPTVLAVLVASCPCALSLATPAALTVASVKLLKKGILVNNLDAITHVHKIKNWFFDKTGTLTQPTMSILGLQNFSQKDDAELFKIAAALEQGSSHPLASAFHDFFDEKIGIENFKEITNQGIQAEIGKEFWQIGSQEFCQVKTDLLGTSSANQLFLCRNKKLLGIFELDNPLRPHSHEVIDFLKQNSYQTFIMSGDKPQLVAQVAKELGIENFAGQMQPKDKINRIIAMQQQHELTVMLGDGVNDAPVLAQSDVSVSFNQGTQLARAASDFIIMGNSLQSLLDLLAMSKKTNTIIKQNILWSLFYNLSVVPFAMMGYLTPWMAAIGMSLSSLLVILNAKRIG